MTNPNRRTNQGQTRFLLLGYLTVLGFLWMVVQSFRAHARYASPRFRASPEGRAVLWCAGAFQSALDWAAEHPLGATLLLALGFGALLLAYRQWMLFKGNLHRRIVPTGLEPQVIAFPLRRFEPLRQIGRRPKGRLFVGMTYRKRRLLPGHRWEPLYLDDQHRAAHRHVLGKTGSGKTTSVLWPQVLQDALDGKGMVVMDAKGSDENVQQLKGLCAVARRQQDLRIFSLPAWNEPDIFTHGYNLAWVRPRKHNDRGGDPTVVTERLMTVLPLGDNDYYRSQAKLALGALLRLLHGMVDANGDGVPFNLEDVMVCLRGIGTTDAYGRALKHCLKTTVEKQAAQAFQSQLARLGASANECLSGLTGAIESFQSPIVNAYAPDIVFEEVLEKNLIVYLQLPTNLFKLQAPALGKALLMDIQQAGSLRQVFRRQRNQRPFSVVVDEFASFADVSVIDSLNKLRDANMLFTLSHQSLADLEFVSKEFAQAVWDNTLTKDVLSQDNPELCERIAKSLGTYEQIERTVQVNPGPLLTETFGGSAARKGDAYKLHPNCIKGLASVGQGYLLGSATPGSSKGAKLERGYFPVCYPRLPDLACDYELVRNRQSRARGQRLYARFIEAEPRLVSNG